MWLSKQQKKSPASQAGDVGEVTLTGHTLGVELDSERRGMAVYAPGGYCWKPALGQRVLVLKAGEEPCVLAVPVEAGELAPGEVALSGPAGARVKLNADGSVTLGPRVQVEGSLYLDGKELGQWVRELVAQLAEEK